MHYHAVTNFIRRGIAQDGVKMTSRYRATMVKNGGIMSEMEECRQIPRCLARFGLALSLVLTPLSAIHAGVYCPRALQLHTLAHWSPPPAQQSISDVWVDGNYAYLGHYSGDQGVTIINLPDLISPPDRTNIGPISPGGSTKPMARSSINVWPRPGDTSIT
jgi:hypothetical protein